MTSPTPQEKARAEAQAKANATGKPWAVGVIGHHRGAHKWTVGCPDADPCQRIDPEPARGEGYEPEGASTGSSVVDSMLDRDDDRRAALRATFAYAPLTLRQRFALAAPTIPNTWFKPDHPPRPAEVWPEQRKQGVPPLNWEALRAWDWSYGRALDGQWPWAYADAVLAAERGEGKT